MSDDRFCFYAEPVEAVKDDRRGVIFGLGEVGGLELAFLSVGKNAALLTIPEMRHLAEILAESDPAKMDRTSGYYLYRVEYVTYPTGSWWEEGEVGGINPDWTPEGWDPDDEYVERFGGRRFFWPSVKHEYRSLSSAKGRAKLIESYGATTRIVQSSLITWPAPIEEAW